MSLQIIHTADWHLGQTFFGYGREEEHEAFLTWLAGLLKERQTDVLLVAGDVFDVANPSAAAQRQFFRFLRQAHEGNARLQMVIIAGNHDSAARLEAPVPLLEEWNTHIVGILPRREDGSVDLDALLIPLYNKAGGREAVCMAVPFMRQGIAASLPGPTASPPGSPASPPGPLSLREGESFSDDREGSIFQSLLNHLRSSSPSLRERGPGGEAILLSHLYAQGAELSDDDRSERVIVGGLEGIGVEAFDPSIAYVALGHIHKAQRVGGRDTIRYAGSPLPMSFSETAYNHQVVSIVLDSGKAEITSIPIPKRVGLIRIPAKPEEADVVLAKLAELPEQAEGDDTLYPFLEVQVLMTGPDPGFRHRVEEALRTKAVRLAHIVPVYPAGSPEAGGWEPGTVDLQQISPLEMLRHTFEARYGNGLPAELEQLFNEVLREVEP